MKLRHAAFMAAVAITAACGSTVTLNTTGQSEQAGSLGEPGMGSVPLPRAGSSMPAAEVASGRAGATSSSARSGVTGASAPTEAGSATSSSSRVNADGVTKHVVPLGFVFSSDLGTAGAALGANGPLPSDQTYTLAVQSTVDYINKHGGIAGRRAVAVVRGNPLASNDYATEGQATCDYFTRDTPVFAVASVYPKGGSLAACLAQRHVPFLYQFSVTSNDAKLRASIPYYYVGAGLSVDRYGIWIDRLAAQGYFGGWNTVTGAPDKTRAAHVGMITFDDNVTNPAISSVIRAHLAKYKLKLDDQDIFYLSGANSFADAGKASNEIANAVLKFRSRGVTHVLFYVDYGGTELFFGPDSSSQHYYPRWGLNTLEAIYSGVQSTDPPDVLRGAMGIGWEPIEDVDAAHDPGQNTQQKLCEQIFSNAGISPPRQWTLLQLCDDAFFFKSALDHATALTPQAMYSAAVRFGDTFHSALTLTGRTALSRGRVDWASQARDIAYDQACGCFAYHGPIYTLP